MVTAYLKGVRWFVVGLGVVGFGYLGVKYIRSSYDSAYIEAFLGWAAFSVALFLGSQWSYSLSKRWPLVGLAVHGLLILLVLSLLRLMGIV